MTDWRLAWRLARRELDLRFRGLRLLLACLFLGVGALAAIGGTTDAVGDELARRGATILGGDVQLSVSGRAATPAERAWIAQLGTVSRSVRMQATAIGGSARAPLVVPIDLKAVDGRYPLYGRLTLADGRTVGAPSAGRAWIAPALADRLGLRRGGTFRLGTATFAVDGIVADEPDRLGEGFTLGPVAMIPLADVARTGLVQPGSLFENRYRIRLSPSRDPAAVAEAWRRAHPVAGWEIKTRDRAAPGAARFLDRMGRFLLLIGLSALAIAGVGVGNGVSSYLAARRPSIAALKVLGATAGIVARVYLLQVGVVAAAGIVLGLAAGMAAVPLIVWAAGDLLPVAPGFAVHAGALAQAAAYGLLVALAFTARPLADAGAVPAAGLLRGVFAGRGARLRQWLPAVVAAGLAIVALAIGAADQRWLGAGFLGAVAALLALLAAVGWAVRPVAAALPRPRRPLLRLALAGLHRPGARTGTLVVALGLGLTLFVLLAAIRTSIDANIARTVPARAPSLFALDVPPAREAEFRRTVAAAEPRATVKTVPAMRGTITGYGATRVADLKTIPEGAWALRGERGLTYAETLPEGSTLTAGRWWPRGYEGPPLVSIDERLARALNLRLGDPLSIGLLGVERTVRIASFRRIDWDTLGFNYVMVFSPNAIADAPHNLAATIYLPPGRAGAVLARLSPRFPSVSVIEVGGVLAQVRTLVAGMAAAITAAASVAILAGLAVLVGAIAAAREARVYDGVMLKTLGATRAQVLGVQALEYAMLCGVLALLAVGIGLGGGWYVVVRLFDFAWAPDWSAVARTLAVGVAVTMAVGLAGAWPVLSARPARALREL